MPEIIPNIHDAYRWAHVGMGFVGLVLFWVVVAARKGSRLHRYSGMTFAGIAYFVGVTGLISCVWGLFDPWSFIGRTSDSIAQTEHWIIQSSIRFMLSILLILSLAVVTGVTFGLMAVRARERHERFRSPLLIGLEFATLMTCAAAVVYGGWHLYLGFRGDLAELRGGHARYWVLVALGLIFGCGTIGDLRYIFGPPPPRGTWIIKHLEAMLGLGVAFYTAFAVFGANRLFAIQLPGAWALLPWLLPTAIGIPWISMTARRWRDRLGLSDSPDPESAGPAQAPVAALALRNETTEGPAGYSPNS